MPHGPGELNTKSAEEFGVGRLFWLTHEAIVGADLETETIVLWNSSAERIFGYTADQALGMPLARLVPAALLDAHHAGISRYRSMAPPQLVGGPPIEVPAIRCDGEVLTIALTLTALEEADHRRHVVAVIRDVTAQKKAEEDRQHMFEAMEAFVSTASHDLRTPLTSILGYSRMLVDRGDDLDPTQRRDFAAAIVRAGEHASRLVDDLLTLSKIQAGVVDVRAGCVALHVATREALSASNVDAELDVPATIEVWADRDHLQRILCNLLLNASKYGRPPITVSARVAADADAVELTVCDRGDGVPPEFAAALFEPFARAPGSKSQPGTGLGLSIVKGLVEGNGGTVSYEAHETGGACFLVTLQKPPA